MKKIRILILLPLCLGVMSITQCFPGDGYPNPDALGVSGHGPALSYTDNGDGTFRDNNTQKVWEKKDNAGGIHDFDNTYGWSTNSLDPNGALWTLFLYTLNNTCQNNETVDCNANGDADCAGVGGKCGFAGHRDWRIPNLKELESIVDSSEFNPAYSAPDKTTIKFDTTDSYWTATTGAGNSTRAWVVFFNFGLVNDTLKNPGHFARAVRK